MVKLNFVLLIDLIDFTSIGQLKDLKTRYAIFWENVTLCLKIKQNNRPGGLHIRYKSLALVTRVVKNIKIGLIYFKGDETIVCTISKGLHNIFHF